MKKKGREQINYLDPIVRVLFLHEEDEEKYSMNVSAIETLDVILFPVSEHNMTRKIKKHSVFWRKIDTLQCLVECKQKKKWIDGKSMPYYHKPYKIIKDDNVLDYLYSLELLGGN